MQIIRTIKEMKEFSRKAKTEGKTIGFVPTMGCLHQGHLSLLDAAKKENDIVVMSIFVNPAQFTPGEDFEDYPRDFSKDKYLASESGVDAIFAPGVEEMYPSDFSTFVEVDGTLTDALCGPRREGHFRGVTTIVSKLFNIVTPDNSYFGQKDAQQAVILKRMARDLDMDTLVKVMPIVREEDGLAMSSRNVYLKGIERKEALGLHRSLVKAGEMISSGIISSPAIKDEIKKILSEGKSVVLDYIEIVDADTLEPLEEVKDNTLIAVAAIVGKARLIDNVIVTSQKS